MAERKMYGGRIIAAFVLALILFSSVFMFGYLVSQNRYDENFYEQQRILRSYLTLQVEQGLLENTCSPEAIDLSAKNLDELGVFITLLEEKLGFNDETLKEQKNDYYLLAAEHLQLAQKQNNNCEEKNEIILFFYSNKDDFIDRAEEIGFILLTAKEEQGNILIYSFDYDATDYSLIEILKSKYNVKDPNTVVVNGNIAPTIGHIDDINAFLDENRIESKGDDSTIYLN